MSMLEELCKKAGWKKGDGITPGHFRKYRPNNQLIWNVKWSTSTGILEPKYILPTSQMDAKQIMLEVESLLYSDRGDMSKRAGRLLHEKKDKDKYEWQISAVKLIGDSRRYCEEFTCHFDPPPAERLIAPRYRPEWYVKPQPERVVEEPRNPNSGVHSPGIKKPSNPDYWKRGKGTPAQWAQYREDMAVYEEQKKSRDTIEKVKRIGK